MQRCAGPALIFRGVWFVCAQISHGSSIVILGNCRIDGDFFLSVSVVGYSFRLFSFFFFFISAGQKACTELICLWLLCDSLWLLSWGIPCKGSPICNAHS